MNRVSIESKTYTVGGSGYFDVAFGDADKLISQAEDTLRGLKIDFDSMVAIGLSGHLVLPLLARHFGVPFLALRKPDVACHDTYGGGQFGRGTIGHRYVIVDDFVATGKTIRSVRDRIDTAVEFCNIPFKPEYMGTYAYTRFGSHRAGTFHRPDGRKSNVRKIEFSGEIVYVNPVHYDEVERAYYRALEIGNPDPKGTAITEVRLYTNASLSELSKMAVYAERYAEANPEYDPWL